jgi:hypothetical protein
MHAVLGHELGHGFLFQQPLADQIKVPTDKYVDSLVAKEKTLFDRDETKTAFAALIDTWLEELLADAWGLHLIGPAYYFACSSEIEEAPPSFSHPAGHLRLQFLLAQLRRRQYLEVPGPLGHWLREYSQKESHRHQQLAKTVQSNRFFDAGHGALKGVADDIFSVVESQRRSIAFKPARFEKVAGLLTDRLCNLVPPNDMDGTTVNLPDVLNAGWLVWHRHWDGFCQALDAKTSQDRFAALSKLNRLLLKALEYSAIETHWRRR